MMGQACAPTCAESCRKLTRCELNNEVVEGYCEESCELQIAEYQGLNADERNDELLTAFRKQRACVVSTSCDDLELGVCYDPDVYPY